MGMDKTDYRSYTEAVTAAKSGDQNAFAWLYQKTSREKYYIAIKYMKNQTEADDVLQEAYVKAWQKIGTLAEPEKFPGWVGQIVANTALSALRKKNPLTFSDISRENEEGEEFVYDIEDESIERQPELNYTTNERQELIRAMIDSLSDEQRMCVMMFYIEEMSVKEIAETLGCSENTVKSRLNYGRKNIKAEAEKLQKKGYSFYSIAPVPLLLLLLRGEKASAMGAAGIVGETAADLAGAAAGHAAAGTAEQVVSGTAEHAAAGIAGKAAAGSAGKGVLAALAGKAVVGVAVVATAGCIGFGGYQVMQVVQPELPSQIAALGNTVQEKVSDIVEKEVPKETANPVDEQKSYYEFLKENAEKYRDYSIALLDLNGDGTKELLLTVWINDEYDTGGNYYARLFALHDGKVEEAVPKEKVSWYEKDGIYLCNFQSDRGVECKYIPGKSCILTYGYDWRNYSLYSDDEMDTFLRDVFYWDAEFNQISMEEKPEEAEVEEEEAEIIKLIKFDELIEQLEALIDTSLDNYINEIKGGQ